MFEMFNLWIFFFSHLICDLITFIQKRLDPPKFRGTLHINQKNSGRFKKNEWTDGVDNKKKTDSYFEGGQTVLF